jgi:hypothetical protein
VSKFFQPSPIDEPFNGWAPDVQILTEADLKKIEKQEERKARYDKRRRWKSMYFETKFINLIKAINNKL